MSRCFFWGAAGRARQGTLKLHLILITWNRPHAHLVPPLGHIVSSGRRVQVCGITSGFPLLLILLVVCALQLDKQKESKMSEFEEEVLSFEGQFQEISMETQVLQEKYRGERLDHLTRSSYCTA